MSWWELRVKATVQRWSGKEVRALREARRMSVRGFADHLGVSDRMVSKWEARGDTIYPRPVNQEALDTSLASCSDEEQARFGLLLASSPVRAARPAPPWVALPEATVQHQVRHPVDGKLMALVPAGVFLAGRDDQPMWLDAFYIDVHTTTNADYARFVMATGHPPSLNWTDGRFPPDLGDHPVVYVTWHDANAYAQWAGKSLPEASQWEKAARGAGGDIYPWGSQRTPAKCNVREGGIGATTPVDRYHSGVSSYGIYDLCGNAWEWCSTETEPGRYELKGSAFTSPFHRATPSNFNDASGEMYDDDTSFRCSTTVAALEVLLSR